MKSFKQIISESVNEKAWNGSPTIGWWEDASPLFMYHGTHISNIERIKKNGILAPKEGYTAGWVSLALEPNTAHGYASMGGGETAFRELGAKARHIPDDERVVFILKFKNVAELQKLITGPMRGAIEGTRNKLNDKKEYEKSTLPDVGYYGMTEIRIKGKVNKKFIHGYMRKKK